MTHPTAPDPADKADAELAELLERARNALTAPELALNPRDPAHACAIGALEVLRLAWEARGEIVDDGTAVRVTAEMLGELARYARNVA